MVHLRIVAPPEKAELALEALESCPTVINVIHLRAVAHKPDGDVILCDVAREDASVIIADLKALEIHKEGSIAVELVDTEVSDAADLAEKLAAGAPSDAVIWEEVGERTSESSTLSASFVVFMVLAAWIAAVGILLDSPILVVGAMVVGPEFGPIAGFCVAAVQRERRLAVRSGVALVVGFPLTIAVVCVAVQAFKLTGLFPETFSSAQHSLANIIADPDFFTFLVAACAGAAGMLSLSTAKSGALIGVLISVTTIPAAANIGLSAAYQDWSSCRGSVAQLAINLGSIILAGTAVLAVQRWLYERRRRRHMDDPERRAANLPFKRRTPATPRSRPSS
jgi:uncharacterized hydrophobic protein (TIGR00271 family)